jgi:hypothetical protein
MTIKKHRRYQRLQLESNNGRLSDDNSGSNLLHLQSPKASFVLHTSWCPAVDSPNGLSSVCTWGLWSLSCSRAQNQRVPPLNLRINDKGVVVHLRWHSPNNKEMISSTCLPSMRSDLMQSCGNILWHWLGFPRHVICSLFLAGGLW